MREATVLSVSERPQLTVATPTYHRPDGLLKALASVTQGAGHEACRVELVVSDNSTDTRSESVVASVFGHWSGPTTYVRHEPSLDKTANQNACVELASGEWLLILHDDDYLLPGGVQQLLDGTAKAEPNECVLLFGVRVVNERGTRLRHQRFIRRRRQPPMKAMRRLLTDPSYVRIPAICVRRDAYAAVGPFDTSLYNVNDYDMWLRLFARFGVTQIPRTISTYVVHSEAATEDMFDADGISQIRELFQRAASTEMLTPSELRHRQREFLHHFILAGSLRRLRRGDWHGANRILRLFTLPDVSELGWSPRWSPVRACFEVTTALMARGGAHSSRS